MSATGQKRKCVRSRGMSVRPSGADIVGLHVQVSTLVDRPVDDGTAALLRVQIAEVSSGSAINITSEVIDHGHRTETTSTMLFFSYYFSGVTTGCAPGNPLIGQR
jgi:hypothetical protein